MGMLGIGLIGQVPGILAGWAFDLVKSGIGKIVRKQRLTAQFREDCDSADRLLKYDDNGFSFAKWLRNDLSIDLQNRLANNDIDYVDALSDVVAEKAKECGVDACAAERIADIFLRSCEGYIKKNRPELYNQLGLGRRLATIDKDLQRQVQMLHDIQVGLSSLAQKSKKVCRAENWFERIENKTVDPKLGLGYFDVDNETFIDRFASYLSRPYFAVSYYCLEEAVGCIANTLLRLDLHRSIIIVENEESWEAFGQRNPSGMILLAAFETEDAVVAIPNNTCIFFTASEAYPNMETIALPKRKLRSLEERLKEAGASSDRTTALLEETNGIYFSLLSKVSKGKPKEYQLKSDSEDLIQAFLVFPTIYQDEGAFDIIQKVTSLPFDRFNRRKGSFVNGSDPLLVKRRLFNGGVAYRLSSIERAWCQYGKFYDENDYLERIQTLFDALLQIGEPSRDPSGEGNFLRGIFQSISFYVTHVSPLTQPSIDSVVHRFLSEALKKGTFGYWIGQGYHLVEASPEGLLSFLEEERTLVLQELNKKDSANSEPYVCHILTKAMLYPGYGKRATRLAFEYLLGREGKGNVGPHLEDVVEAYFIPWFNQSGDSAEAIIKEAKNLMDLNPHRMWGILDAACAARTSMSVGVSLSYRAENERFDVLINDYWKLKNAYFSLLLEHAGPIQMVTLLDDEDFVAGAHRLDSVLESLSDKCKGLSDVELFELAMKLYALVDRARRFRREYYNGDASQAFLDKLWDLADCLGYRKDGYRYLRLFALPHEFSQRQPTPLDDDGYLDDDNKKNQQRIALWREAQKRGKTFNELCGLLLTITDKFSGFDPCDTAMLISERRFDKSIYVDMVSNGFSADAARYARYTTNDDDKMMWDLYHESGNADLSAELMNLLPVDDVLLDELEKRDCAFRKLYWDKNPYAKQTNISCVSRAVRMCLESENHNCALLMLLSCIDELALPTVLDLIRGIDLRNSSSAYDVSEYFERHKEEILANYSYLQDVAILELGYRQHTGGGTFFIDNAFSAIPAFYLHLLSFVYTNDDNERTGNTVTPSKKLFDGAFGILWSSRFCPGVFDGAFDGERFADWMQEAKRQAAEKRMTTALCLGLAKAFSHAPSAGNLPFPKAICEFIEKEKSKTLDDEICTGLFNRRGVHSPSAGREEEALSTRYRVWQDSLQESGYIRCARIFKRLADDYKRMSVLESERAETESL